MITLEGLVISERDAGETGKSVTLLTKERACIDVYVRGGKKSRTAVSSTQLFCYAKFSLEEKKDAYGNTRYYFNSSEPISIFYNIRLDAKKTALGCYFAEIIKFAVSESDDTGEVMRLALNTFYFLNKGDRDPELLKSVFEFRLLCDTGYRPNLIGCCHCYAVEDDRMHFNLKTGLIECSGCVTNPESMYDMTFDRMLFYTVRYIALVEIDRLFNFKISGRYQRQLTAFTERFAEYYYGKKFDTLTFYKLL